MIRHLAALIVVIVTPHLLTAAEYSDKLGPHEVATLLADWQDARRNRQIPVKIYFPRELAEAAPVILFSHGLGGTREGYAYLGSYWSSHGYVSVHLQHIGSDDQVWRGKDKPLEEMRNAVGNGTDAVHRPLDVRFALDTLTALNADRESPLFGRLDMQRVGIAGHSYGAYTTLATAGQRFARPGRAGMALSEPRIKAAIPMSAPVPAAALKEPATAYGAIAIPCFHMTGTADQSIVSDTTPEQRRIPYDHSLNARRYLLIFKDGDHMVFSGRARKVGQEGQHDEAYQALIRVSSLAFWDAYLRGDKAAETWLADGGFAKLLGDQGTFEQGKPAAK